MATAKAKTYSVKRITERTQSSFILQGTIDELTDACSYTLDKGASWQHEKGNAKINCKPKNIASLVKNLNNAVNNAAANGYAGVTYVLLTDADLAAARAKVVKGIMQWMAAVRADSGIADIEDALGEFSTTIAKEGLTRNEVYEEFRKQFA
jgi:hypothetical protein